MLQASREDRSSTCSAPAATVSASQRLLEDALSRPAPYPMIVVPGASPGSSPGGSQNGSRPGPGSPSPSPSPSPSDSRGYWVDGAEHECAFDPMGNPVLPHSDWRAHKFETDETARCYRRFFVGRVSSISMSIVISTSWRQQLWTSF